MGKNGSKNHDFRKKALTLSDMFFELEGRRPRVLVGTFRDHTKTTLNKIANSLSDNGFDVDISPAVTTGQSICINALENDVDVLLILIDESGFKANILHLENSLDHYKAEILLLYICDDCRQNYQESQTLKNRTILDVKNNRSEMGLIIIKKLLDKTGS